MFRLWSSKITSIRPLAAGVSSSLRHPHRPLSFVNPSFTRNAITATSSRLPSRQVSNMLDPKSLTEDLESELFNYTGGRFLANEPLRLRERRRVFNIPGLFGVIAKALPCKSEGIVGFKKLGEGEFYRAFLITLDTGFQLVARIPYPLLYPKGYALASEVATMDFLRSKGIPIPKVYAYSFTPKNEAETEYILMEYAEGVDLSQKLFDLNADSELKSLTDQLAKIESTMMSIPFPAGGSIYYARDLKELSGNEGIPLDEHTSLDKARFCMGPDVSGPLWYGRREQLYVFRGPYEDVRSVLVAGARKELAYLDRFGSPRLPEQHLQRVHYNFEKQSPSDHANNLRRYLRLAPWLAPDDDSLNAFCIRHPDLAARKIRISIDSSGLQVLSLLSWHHTAILPLFLHASEPYFVLHEADEASRRTIEPRLPGDFKPLSKEEQKELVPRLLVHVRYIESIDKYNKIHHKALVHPFRALRRKLFNYASRMWDGETIQLLVALMELAIGDDWKSFAKDGTPCPVVFKDEEIYAAINLHEKLGVTEWCERMLMEMVGYWGLTWVPVTHYETAKQLAQDVKQMGLEEVCENEEEKVKANAMTDGHWPFDDKDEEELEEYK